MQCEKIIHQTLDAMGFKFEKPHQLVESWNKCLRILCQLGEECSDALMQIGKELLNSVNRDASEIEDKLWMVLEAIARRNQSGALELTAAALFNEKTKRKEEYVDILARFEDGRAIPALIHAVKADCSTGDMGGWTRYKAINALLRLEAREAALMIIPYVKDSVDRVRSVAIDFLLDLDVHEAAPAFIEQLSKEDDLDNLEKLISGLVSWKRTDSLPILRDILASDWVKADEELQVVVKDAISGLEVIEKKEPL